MIDARELSYRYKATDSDALSDLSFHLDAGEKLRILGANGSGKSTLIKLIAGALEPSSGSLSCAGRGTQVRQHPREQLLHARVRDELVFTGIQQGLTKDEAETRCDEVLAMLGLRAAADTNTAQLSSSEQQLLALAAALTQDPDILILDEALSSLDEKHRVHVRQLLLALQTQGMTIVEATHNLGPDLSADKTLVLSDGRALWYGSGESWQDDAAVRTTLGLDLDLSLSFHVDMNAEQSVEQFSARELCYLEGQRLPLNFASSHAPLLLRGCSGSGKTKLARILAAVDEPLSGEVELNGEQLLRGQAALVFETPEDQLFAASCYEDIAFGIREQGLDEAEVEVRVDEACELLGIGDELIGRSPFELSGGERRRVALAALYVLDRPVYIFDEPMRGLDRAGKFALAKLMERLTLRGKALVVLTSDASDYQGSAFEELPLDEFYESCEAPQEEKQSNFAEALIKLDPRVKIATLLAFTISCFMCSSLLPLLGAAGIVLLCAFVLRVKPKELVRLLLPVLLLIVLVFVSHAFVVSTEPSFALSWSGEGALRGLALSLRIILPLEAAYLMSKTTSEMDMSDALTSFISPLGKLGVPVEDASLSLSVALRFIPLVREEIDKIVVAQELRSVDFGSGGLKDRLESWLSVLAPTSAALFRRSDILAEVLVERGYGNAELGTSLGSLSGFDIGLLVLALALCVLLAVL